MADVKGATSAPAPTTQKQVASPDAEAQKLKSMLRDGPGGIFKKTSDFIQSLGIPSQRDIISHIKS